MKTTYYIERKSDNVIVNYYTKLFEAKLALLHLVGLTEYRIVCLKGPYKYEGRRAYYLYHDGFKFKKDLKFFENKPIRIYKVRQRSRETRILSCIKHKTVGLKKR